jgi:tetratricopeptide (TPR) repeat protein
VNLFTFEIPSTKSSVLVTSRRDIPGIKSFTIRGFEFGEARSFVSSRIELYGLDSSGFPDSVVEEVRQATDGSPLYMEDLLRLTRIVPVTKAIEMWNDKQGDEARKYALQRELEMLSGDAKKVLLAACVTEEPVSFAQIESVLKISEDRLVTALGELQTMFLIPKPKVVEGEQRFELNANTRKLVQAVEGESDTYARIETASKALTGELPNVGRGIVSALIRQAYLLTASSRFGEAESLLLQAIDKYPQVGDLQGFMGFVYRRWNRHTDARKYFEAAYKLKCRNRETYRHWVRMEMSANEWTKAIDAAEKGLRIVPGFYDLHALRAEAKLRSGIDFAARLQKEKASKLWRDAASELMDVLKAHDQASEAERETNASMYRTLTSLLDRLGEYRALKHYMSLWEKEHFHNDEAKRQREVIEARRGLAIEDLAERKVDVPRSSRPRPF